MTSSSDNKGGEPDLTPILDMVFQLITFFMLVINFKGAALDLELQLPVLGSARPLENEGQEGLLVLNIDSEGRLKIYGTERDVDTYIAEEARIAMQKLKNEGKEVKPGDELP
ncbi:MAG: biopolymer transporter ExbD, partial [Planctomycetaceae bacterium]|nr:biopolymer transporter ExbD [Planctomycetaceae bacterium]